MLDEILDSGLESNIIGFLLVAPPRSFSEVELSARLQIPTPKLVSVLDYLVKQAQVKKFSKNSKRYYLLNQKYRKFAELRSQLVGDRPVYEDELFSAIRKLGNIEAAFLSGLFTGHPELPVDILIVGNVVDTWMNDFIGNCERMMGQEVNYSVMSVKEFQDRRNTFDRFIKDIFDYPYIAVVDKITK